MRWTEVDAHDAALRPPAVLRVGGVLQADQASVQYPVQTAEQCRYLYKQIQPWLG